MRGAISHPDGPGGAGGRRLRDGQGALPVMPLQRADGRAPCPLFSAAGSPGGRWRHAGLSAALTVDVAAINQTAPSRTVDLKVSVKVKVHLGQLDQRVNA